MTVWALKLKCSFYVFFLSDWWNVQLNWRKKNRNQKKSFFYFFYFLTKWHSFVSVKVKKDKNVRPFAFCRVKDKIELKKKISILIYQDYKITPKSIFQNISITSYEQFHKVFDTKKWTYSIWPDILKIKR